MNEIDLRSEYRTILAELATLKDLCLVISSPPVSPLASRQSLIFSGHHSMQASLMLICRQNQVLAFGTVHD